MKSFLRVVKGKIIGITIGISILFVLFSIVDLNARIQRNTRAQSVSRATPTRSRYAARTTSVPVASRFALPAAISPAAPLIAPAPTSTTTNTQESIKEKSKEFFAIELSEGEEDYFDNMTLFISACASLNLLKQLSMGDKEPELNKTNDAMIEQLDFRKAPLCDCLKLAKKSAGTIYNTAANINIKKEKEKNRNAGMLSKIKRTFFSESTDDNPIKKILLLLPDNISNPKSALCNEAMRIVMALEKKRTTNESFFQDFFKIALHESIRKILEKKETSSNNFEKLSLQFIGRILAVEPINNENNKKEYEIFKNIITSYASLRGIVLDFKITQGYWKKAITFAKYGALAAGAGYLIYKKHFQKNNGNNNALSENSIPSESQINEYNKYADQWQKSKEYAKVQNIPDIPTKKQINEYNKYADRRQKSKEYAALQHHIDHTSDIQKNEYNKHAAEWQKSKEYAELQNILDTPTKSEQDEYNKHAEQWQKSKEYAEVQNIADIPLESEQNEYKKYADQWQKSKGYARVKKLADDYQEHINSYNLNHYQDKLIKGNPNYQKVIELGKDKVLKGEEYVDHVFDNSPENIDAIEFAREVWDSPEYQAHQNDIAALRKKYDEEKVKKDEEKMKKLERYYNDVNNTDELDPEIHGKNFEFLSNFHQSTK